MKRLVITVGVVGFLLVVSGCTTTTSITKLPTKAEFSKDLAALQNEYPDLTKYAANSRECAPIVWMPDAEPLLEAWGKPHHKRVSALMFIDPVGGLLFYPSNCWYWEFEDKEVVARINHPMGFGYTPHVWKLKVQPRK